MHIEFDPAKNSANIKKHDIALGEGASALLDPLALVKEDRGTVKASKDLWRSA